MNKPVLVVHGTFGSLPTPLGFASWLSNLGVIPTDLRILDRTNIFTDEPLDDLGAYFNTIKALKDQGYQEGVDLFIATYDWRVSLAPVDQVVDGKVTGISGSQITDNKYEYGLDYLGYWLNQAADAWQRQTNTSLDSVDVIAHSMGGLLTRSYIQSTAYGDGLPKINNFVMLGTPNQGASKAWSPMNDDWSIDPIYTSFANIILLAYRRAVGFGVTGTDGKRLVIPTKSFETASGSYFSFLYRPDAETSKLFIERYVPTLRQISPTYDFGVQVPSEQRNDLLMDLNHSAGVDLLVNNTRQVAIGYGDGLPTITTAKERVGPDVQSGAAKELFPFGSPGRQPNLDEVWYEVLTDPVGGDATVPTISAIGLNNSQITKQAFNLDHIALVRESASINFALSQLGIEQQPTANTTNSFDLAATNLGQTTFVLQSAEGFLKDDVGRRLGYTKATGALTEIPGSIWIGDETGGVGFVEGLIDSNPTDQTRAGLELTGLGEDYFANVSTKQDNLFATAELGGFLANGQQRQAEVTFYNAGSPPSSQFTFRPTKLNLVEIEGVGETPLLFETSAVTSTNSTNEIAVLTVDDDLGTIDGIAPGQPTYLQAALRRARSIFSSVPVADSIFQNFAAGQVLNFAGGDRLKFLLIQNGTLDSALAGATTSIFSGLNAANLNSVQFLQITSLTQDSLRLAWEDGASDRDFQDAVITITPFDGIPVGGGLQGKSQGEIIDLTPLDRPVLATIDIYREAFFDNIVGFYIIDDLQGTIRDEAANLISPDQSGYAAVALQNRITEISLSTTNRSTTLMNTVIFPSGKLIAPFLISNGTIPQLLDQDATNDPAVYFPFLGANPDRVDHIRLFGSNTFGFEDLPNGGDFDYNDLLVNITLTGLL